MQGLATRALQQSMEGSSSEAFNATAAAASGRRLLQFTAGPETRVTLPDGRVVLIYPTSGATWYQVHAFCESKGATMVTLDSSATNERITSEINTRARAQAVGVAGDELRNSCVGVVWHGNEGQLKQASSALVFGLPN